MIAWPFNRCRRCFDIHHFACLFATVLVVLVAVIYMSRIIVETLHRSELAPLLERMYGNHYHVNS